MSRLRKPSFVTGNRAGGGSSWAADVGYQPSASVAPNPLNGDPDDRREVSAALPSEN